MRAQLETEKKKALFYERATIALEDRTSVVVCFLMLDPPVAKRHSNAQNVRK